METPIKEQRSGVSQENWQEYADADENKGLSAGKAEQYFTPDFLAAECNTKLPSQSPATIIDPQCGQGALLMRDSGSYGTMRFGIELDSRIQSISGVQLINGSCSKVFEIISDLYPHLRWVCANANNPFGRRWKQPDGSTMDSTEATWGFVTRHANYGYLISNKNTIEKLGLHKHKWTYDYITKKMGDVWSGMRDGELGIVFWQRPSSDHYDHTSTGELYQAWEKIKKAVNEEKNKRPNDYNIWLNEQGILKTYLSVRNTVKLKLDWQTVQQLHTIDNANPLTLVAEVNTRRLLKEFLDAGIYKIQPAAAEAMKNALAEVDTISAPLMPLSDFELIAHVDELDQIICSASCQKVGDRDLRLTAGKKYNLSTGSYRFSEAFVRNKVHFSEKTGETFTKPHDCVLSGVDKYIQITDDLGKIIRFMDRPRKNYGNEFEEALLWEYFEKPEVNTVAETCKSQVEQNIAVLNALEMAAGFKFYEGQKEYLSRLAVKDSGLCAADVGVGKTLFAICLMALKSPQRALLIAPQATVRASKDDEEENFDGAMTASQWILELARFSPYLQVFELFSYDDYKRLLTLNDGELPYGIFVTYPSSFFSNYVNC